MDQIIGKNAVVTGGSGGIGPFIAAALASEGANVALVARTAENLDAVAESLAKFGTRIITIPADITVEADRVRIVETLAASFDGIDILVNNVGIGHWAAFAKQDPALIEKMIDTNFKGPVLLTRKMLGSMLERGAGSIVSVGSLSGKKGLPYLCTYSGTKIALMEWSSGLRLELQGTGVNVSVVAPTYVSKAGMFARFGVKAPLFIGSTTPEKVAKQVIRAIKHNVQEIQVSPIPTRPLVAINSLWPRLGNSIIRLLGLVKASRKLAELEAEKSREQV